MDSTLIKVLILWIICENIVLTTSLTLRRMPNEDANTRQKRSPANNFSLFGFNLGNPVSTVEKSLNGIANIFSGNLGNRHHNNYHEPIDIGRPHDGVRNINTISPVELPSSNVIPNRMAHNNNQKADMHDWSQDNGNEISRKTAIERNKQNQIPDQQQETPESTSIFPGDIDQQLLDEIFRKQELNNDPLGTTVDNNIDLVTETGEFETTTDLGFNRMLPPAAVASLLG